MIMHKIIIAALAVFCGVAVQPSAFAQAPSNPTEPENTLYLDLEYGRVVIQMRPDWAPKHVARIKHLVRGGYYDGMVFHRVIDGFMAQTGDPTGTGSSGSGRKLEAEFTRTPQVRGIVSMARTSNKNSADSQFFIVLKDSRKDLDGKYTAWGEVTAGMEFVDQIRKGGSNGKVSKPDRLVRLQVAADADRTAAAPADPLKEPNITTTVQNFSGSEYRCRALGNPGGSPVQNALAGYWTHGYLAGADKAQNKLAFAAQANDSVETALRDVCSTYPDAFLLAVANRELAKTTRELSPTTSVFSPVSYTCGDYVAARNGTNTIDSDFADLWAFAFIQGFKGVGQPDLEIPFAARGQLLGALAGACARTPTTSLLDLTAQVAEKVKLQ